MSDAVYECLATLPMFAGRARADLAIAPLPGLTNQSFKISMAGADYVLRLPGAGTERYLDRRQEAHNAALAACWGIAPAVLWRDARSGVQLSRYLENSRALTAHDLRDPAILGRVVEVLRRLHRGSRPFQGLMELYPKLDEYLALARPAPFAAELDALRRRAEPLRPLLQRDPEPLRPCHIDPAPHNFLLAPGASARLYLLDWEYSAQCEPVWDVAGLALEAELTADEEARLLALYYGEPSPARRPRYVHYKAVLCLLATAWGAAQIALGNAADGFEGWVRERLRRSAALLDEALQATLR